MIRILLFLFLFFPCSLNAFWPVSWELGDEKRFLGPLVSYDEKDEERHFVFRPLLLSYASEEGGSLDYIYPLGFSSPGKSYFLPIYMAHREDDAQNTAFLLFFHGTHKEKGSYGGFFPIAGKLKKRFGNDEMGFFLWPLYSYTKRDEATKTNILWPFFGTYGGSDQGFKAWPVYGTRTTPGVRRTQFFLWPFFIKQEKNLDTDNPISIFMALPFYVESKSRLHETKGILYPIFSYRRNEDKEEWTYLWPFLSSWKGPETKNVSIFPFYSKEVTGRDRKFYLLYPIYKEEEYYVKEDRYFRRSVLLINRYIEEEGTTFFNIWPFFEYKSEGDDYSFIAPSPLPLRYKGFDTIIKPLFTLYEKRRIDNRTMTSILYGLYTREEENDDWKTRFAFLLSLSRTDGAAGFEILSGLFGIDKQHVKILYIPIKRGDGKSTE